MVPAPLAGEETTVDRTLLDSAAQWMGNKMMNFRCVLSNLGWEVCCLVKVVALSLIIVAT